MSVTKKNQNINFPIHINTYRARETLPPALLARFTIGYQNIKKYFASDSIWLGLVPYNYIK